jgi:hypothetical protein
MSHGVVAFTSWKGEKRGEKMESVQDVKMKLYIQTNKRTVVEEFGSLLDMRVFMDRFFSQVAERRFEKPDSGYKGPERRMRS